MKKNFSRLTKVFFFFLMLFIFFLGNQQGIQAGDINVSVNPLEVKNNDFAQILGGYIDTRRGPDPNNVTKLSENQQLIEEVKKMFPQPPEFPNYTVIRTLNYPLGNAFVITDNEVEDIIKFCSLAGCDPMFGAVGEGETITVNGYTGKAFSFKPEAIKKRALFVKQKCKEYFNDDKHCLRWNIGNEPPTPQYNCDYYGTELIPTAIRAVKEVIPNAIFHTPELFLDSANVRETNETVGECIARKLNETDPHLKIDVFTTHWYPYICSSITPKLGITGETVLNWGGNRGPSYQKMTYPQDIVRRISSWLNKYSVTQNSIIGIGEYNPMAGCDYRIDLDTSRLNLTWGGVFWHLDVLGIMAEAGIKYAQKHIHIGLVDRYAAITVGNDGNVLKTPSYYAYRFYSQYFGNKLVNSQSSKPDVVNSHASLDKDGNLRVILINKSRPATDQVVNISLNNFNAETIGTVYKMRIPDTYLESPRGFNPENPSIYSTINNIPVGSSFKYIVPRYSAVIIKIPRRFQPSSCVCQTDNTCHSSCPVYDSFNRFPDIDYPTSISCQRKNSVKGPTPNTSEKNSFCQRPMRLKGDADGVANEAGFVNHIDYFYHLTAVIGGNIPASVNPDFNGDGLINDQDLDIFTHSR